MFKNLTHKQHQLLVIAAIILAGFLLLFLTSCDETTAPRITTTNSEAFNAAENAVFACEARQPCEQEASPASN